MGNTASLANDDVGVSPDPKKTLIVVAATDVDDEAAATFQPGDSFSMSQNRDKSPSVFMPRYAKREEEDTDTYTSTEGGTQTTKEEEYGSSEEGETTTLSQHTDTQMTTTIGDMSIHIPMNRTKTPVAEEERSMETDMAADGDDEDTIEERRVGRRAARWMRPQASGDEESIQILDAEEEFSQIMTQDPEEDLLLRKARHQQNHKRGLETKRVNTEPFLTVNTTKLPVVEGVDALLDQMDSNVTGPVVVEPKKHLCMEEVKQVLVDMNKVRGTSRPSRSCTKGTMIVVASSDLESPRNKETCFAGTVSKKDCLHKIPIQNLLREKGDDDNGDAERSVVSSIRSAEAVANDEFNTFLDENGIGVQTTNKDEPTMLSPRSLAHMTSPRLPMSPIMSNPAVVGEILRVHDEGKTETPRELAAHEIDMSIVTRFVQTFNSFLRKHPRFAYTIQQPVLDSLRIAKLQKLLTTLSEVESELEEFIESTENQKNQFSKSFQAKLLDCTRKKAARKIELLRSFDEVRCSSQDLEKNLVWELISSLEARAKREHDLHESLAKLSKKSTNPLNLLPDDQAPPIHKILWTEDFSPCEVEQLQIENAFLRSEASVLKQKLQQLISVSKEHSWVDHLFRRMTTEQMSLLRQQHEAKYAHPM